MGRLIIKLFTIIGKFISKNRLNLFGRALSRIIYNFYRSIENHNYDKSSNGELMFLKRLGSLDLEINTIFDVGANKGEWAVDTLKYLPNAKIYCFEPIPGTYKKLKKTLSNCENVRCLNFGLSHKSEEITFYTSDQSDELSSSIKIVAEETNSEIIAEVKNGFEFCKESNIESIDFLKIDVEGMEHTVLDGLSPFLKENKIKIIQFEYGLVNIESKFLLNDFYKLFKYYGYSMGKIYPKGILFKEYAHTDENFIGPNYVAVLEKYKEKFLFF
jgi:FkbM family methyltransferase